MGVTKFPNGVSSDYDGVLYAEIANISAAASSWSGTLPFDAEIVGASVTQSTAVTVASAAVTFEIAGTAITALAATIATGGAAGDAFAAAAPTGANSLTSGTAVEVITDGASTTASKGIVSIYYKRV